MPPIEEWDTTRLLGPLNDLEMRHAPSKLFTRGDVAVLDAGPRIAVVGARATSRDGLLRARRVARFLADHGAVVISGMAAGVDRAAHLAAADAGGRTAAVVGTGLDVIYPPENVDLHTRLACEHLVLSQFPLGTPVRRGNFPQRNRTMALLCEATVIVEAGDSSGTLSQGWEALRLGRALFIMRSVARDASLTWPAEMLRYGAVELADPDQLLPFLAVRDVRPVAVDF